VCASWIPFVHGQGGAIALAQIANPRRPVSLCNKPDHRGEAFAISTPRLNDIQRRFWALNPPKSG
jgi:hypothetical protein